MTRPLRIVSIVPSLTHTLCEFGLIDQIVGCTGFCIDPPQLFKKSKNIGGTKTPDIEAIQALQPTHIFTNDEENTASHIELCESIAPTFRCLPKSPEDVPKLLEGMWHFLGHSPTDVNTQSGSAALTKALTHLKLQPKQSKRFLYLIWRNPWMAAGPDTYISRSLQLIGWHNILDESLGRYPTIHLQDLNALGPEIVIMSSEPYPFRIRDKEALKEEWPACPEIIKADGQLFSWFGSKTLKLVEFLSGGLNIIPVAPDGK